MKKRVAIIGAGPIGVEAAALAATHGFDVQVYERGAIGAHVARWGHVRFFSPWSLNRSAWGVAALREAGVELAPDDAFPTGAEYLRTYLRPLVEAAALTGRIRTLTAVRGITRAQAFKGDLIGQRAEAGPFVIWSTGPEGDAVTQADVVLDASGVYGQPAGLGIGGLPVSGEDHVADLVDHWIPDALDRDRATFAGQRVLLVGDGHSAATTLRLLTDLREAAPDTHVSWLLSRKDPPYAELADDPLPERLALARFGNRAAMGEVDGVEPLRGMLAKFERTGATLARATFADGRSVEVNRVVANVGYRPDIAMTRELQVHYCYASEGPMKLAASLLAASGADCLAQEAAGLDTLRNPETDFWIVGGKSYGRNPNFLLRVGFEQLEAILGSYV